MRICSCIVFSVLSLDVTKNYKATRRLSFGALGGERKMTAAPDVLLSPESRAIAQIRKFSMPMMKSNAQSDADVSVKKQSPSPDTCINTQTSTESEKANHIPKESITENKDAEKQAGNEKEVEQMSVPMKDSGVKYEAEAQKAEHVNNKPSSSETASDCMKTQPANNNYSTFDHSSPEQTAIQIHEASDIPYIDMSENEQEMKESRQPIVKKERNKGNDTNFCDLKLFFKSLKLWKKFFNKGKRDYSSLPSILTIQLISEIDNGISIGIAGPDPQACQEQQFLIQLEKGTKPAWVLIFCSYVETLPTTTSRLHNLQDCITHLLVK